MVIAGYSVVTVFVHLVQIFPCIGTGFLKTLFKTLKILGMPFALLKEGENPI